MQLDKTRIVIRERNYFDILDLALRVIASFPAPLLLTAVIGTAPFVVLNHYVIVSLFGGFSVESIEFEPWSRIFFGYVFPMLALVMLETPLTTALTTLYLGKVTFQSKPTARQIAGEMRGSLGQLLLYQVLLRAVMIAPVVTWIVLYCSWSYLNEVILLERNPLSGRRNTVSTMRRCGALHAGSFGDLLVRWLTAMFVGTILVLVLWLSTITLADLLTNAAELRVVDDETAVFGQIAFTLYFPAALWITVHFFSVVRFLGYLDLRIRREGWEVELKLRAEAGRLAKQWV